MFIKNLLKISVGVSLMALLIGCGGGSGDSIGRIDLAEYMPAESMDKIYDKYEKWPAEEERNSLYVENITVSEVDGNKVIVAMHDGREVSKNVISEDSIKSKRGLIDTTTDRYVNLGDMYYNFTIHVHDEEVDTNVTIQCTLEEHLNSFSMHEHSYSGDIYKSKCVLFFEDLVIDGTTYDNSYITYVYNKKDIGLIAEIGEHCRPYDGLQITDDSNLSECPEDKKDYAYKLLRE